MYSRGNNCISINIQYMTDHSLICTLDAGENCQEGERKGTVCQPNQSIKDSDEAEATQDQGQTMKMSVSTWSMLHDHPANT